MTVRAVGVPSQLLPQVAAVLVVEVTPTVTVKFALSLSLLSQIPARIVTTPKVMVSDDRGLLLPCGVIPSSKYPNGIVIIVSLLLFLLLLL